MSEQREVAIEEPLGVDNGKTLVFLSFKYSQGNEEAQRGIFSYLHILHPSWKVTPELKTEIGKALTKPVERFVGLPEIDPESDKEPIMHHSYFSEQAAQEMLGKMLGFMEKEINSGEIKNKDEVVADIAEKIIDKDYKYLVQEPLPGERKGRPVRTINPEGTYTSSTDPFLSHICYYGLEGNKTGAKEYDALFADIKKYVQTKPPEGRYKLNSILATYNRTHDTNLELDEVTR